MESVRSGRYARGGGSGTLERGLLKISRDNPMALIDTSTLKTGERLPGWRDRTFNTTNMTFAHFDFDAGSKIHEHCHSNEEVWTVLEGELEVTIGAERIVATPGLVAVVPPFVAHSVRAITDGKVIVTDSPVRLDPSGGRRAVVNIDFDDPLFQSAGPETFGSAGKSDATRPAGSTAVPSAKGVGLVSGASIQIPFTLHNWGKTRAIVRELNIECKIAGALPDAVTTEIPGGELPVYCTLEADERHPDSISHSALTSNEVNSWFSGDSILYVRGAIFYDDEFDSRYHRTFCRVYEKGSEGRGTLVPPDKPGYNYGS
jgi:quercetin dioxygenase-like cupin family protein